ncbi:methionine/alanine import family NSS transporter small subunit [Prauserella alba]|nr:methionine/alanine import family NSS transporter small subunit [Prauserella alba]
MGVSAVVMMLVAILVIWGGLALAIANLVRRSPEGRED